MLRPWVWLGTILEPSATVVGLRLVFWGSILCVLAWQVSIPVGDHVYALNQLYVDTIGAALMAYGCLRLTAAELSPDYRKAIWSVFGVTVLAVVGTVASHIPFQQQAVVSLLYLMLGFLEIAASITLCIAMNWFCTDLGLRRSGRRWTITTQFVCIFIGVPNLVVGVANFLTLTKFLRNPVNFPRWEPYALAPMALIALLRFYSNTSAMKREIARLQEERMAPTHYHEAVTASWSSPISPRSSTRQDDPEMK